MTSELRSSRATDFVGPLLMTARYPLALGVSGHRGDGTPIILPEARYREDAPRISVKYWRLRVSPATSNTVLFAYRVDALQFLLH